jgi:DinB superfamily/Pentapeptide repeats (8 copies)
VDVCYERRIGEPNPTSYRGADLRDVDFSGAWFRLCDFGGAVMRGVNLSGASIDGWYDGLTLWGIEVEPLVRAELERRHPEYALLRATDADGLRAAWVALEQLWAGTLARVERMPPAVPGRSVAGEWSLAQTLRHLVFATDGWLRDAILGVEHAFHPLGQPFSEFGTDGPRRLGIDLAADPPFSDVLELRGGRQAMVRDYLAAVTPEQLASRVGAPPWEEVNTFTALDCLHVILEEEWLHHRIATRDLDAIEAGA